eukprot:CAMPEP_0172687942 /NCGR_PEP_ID=MMETSP1074-20121228/22058_1 /TAXON_ID=2916 /ORGANISM="Ceratium fusus, Strain PA161109" /LENGTH=564 /DNA_ID=CAMNT_0013507485 /DNA_START=32 /DNA_END=1726 /DNA_ORIENTATION=+
MMAWFPLTAAVVALAGVAEAHPRVMLNALLAVKKQASKTASRATTEAKEQQDALQSYAASMAGVAVADRKILAEARSAEEQTEQLLKDGAIAPEVSRLFKNIQHAGQHLVASETRSARASGHEAALLATQASSHVEKTQEMQQELQIVEQRVASLMREHPKELHKVEELLRTASRMIKHSGVAHSLQQRSNARIALLARSTRQSRDAMARSEMATGRRALLRYADGMSKVVKMDKGIVAATKKAEDQIEQIFSGDNEGIGFDVAQLLDTAQKDERSVVAMEAHDAREARNEARQLDGSSAFASGDKDDPQNSRATPEDGVEGLLRSITGSTRTQKPMSKKLHRAVLAESSSSTRAKLRARLEPVKQALAQHLGLAMRQARLAERGEDLAVQLQETRNSVMAELQGGPDPVDRDVAMELQKHLGAAERMLRELAFFHKEMALDVGRTASALVSYGRQVVKKEHKRYAGQLLQQHAARNALTALTSRVKSAARRTMHHAAAELRNEHRLFAETALAQKAVQTEVQGPGAAKVRSIVGRLLRRAEQAEKGAAHATRMEMQLAREAAH